MNEKTSLCTVIVSYNQKEALKELLNRLLEIRKVQPMKVLLVLNACTDGTEDMLHQDFAPDLGNLNIHKLERNSGGAGGFRKGMEEALKMDCSHIWLMDDDILPDVDALDQLLHTAESIPQWGALGSLVARKEAPDTVTETGGDICWWKGRLTCFNSGADLEQCREKSSFQVGHCAAASLLVNPEAVKKMGFFEDIFIHFDDVEWCYRLKRGGYPVYSVPSSVVWHPYKRGTTPPWIRYYDARNILLVYRRNRRLMLFIPWLRFRLMALVFRFRSEPASAKAIKLGQKDFFAGRIRYRDELSGLL